MAIHSIAKMDEVSIIRRFIAENILFVADELGFGDEDSFIENGILDSTGILEVQLFVEEAFGIHVEDEEVLPENFDSIKRMADYVRRKQLAHR